MLSRMRLFAALGVRRYRLIVVGRHSAAGS